ncbi:MAG: hypothetical protein C4287_16280, partial [Leptolyngbya sp. ERB_1_2]
YQVEPPQAAINPAIFFTVLRGKVPLGSTLNQAPDSNGGIVQLPPNLLTKATLTLLNLDGSQSSMKMTVTTSIKTEVISPSPDLSKVEVVSSAERVVVNRSTNGSGDTVMDVLPTLDRITDAGIRNTVAPISENGTGSLQQIVDGALGDLLGRNLKPKDGQAFRSSLTQSFTAKQANGHIEYVLTPRTFAATQTDLGGTLSGAQASLYHRSKAALNEMLPLLDKLQPLDVSSDPQNLEAARAIVRTEITEVVEEMGTQGGPRGQRVETLFQLLLGDVNSINTELVSGQLKDLADRFGLTRSRINTVEEEQNYSNFLIIRDYLVSLRESWNAFVANSGKGAYVGTQLVLLSRAMLSVEETVQEVYRIMELFFLGPQERQTIFIDFTRARDTTLTGTDTKFAFLLPDGTGVSLEESAQLKPGMSVEALLSWAYLAATKEWRILAKKGGKIGIAQTITESADKLMVLTQAASYVPVPNTAFRRAGVKRALQDLAFQLSEVKRLAEALNAPPALPGANTPVLSGSPNQPSPR